MTFEPPQSLRRIAAVALLLAVLASAAANVVSPLASLYQSSVEERDRLQSQLARLKTIAGSASAVATAQAALAARLDRERLHYKDATADIAAARLQQAVAELIRAKGGEMRLARMIEKSQAAGQGSQGSITVAFSFAIANDGLAPLLFEIEGLRPVVLVDDLSVRANRSLDAHGQSAQVSEAAGPFRDEPILDVGLEASAFLADGSVR